MDKESKYGKGFIYCLFEVAKHYERLFHYKESINYKDVGRGIIANIFVGIADHLDGLAIPTNFKTKKIAKLAKWIKETALKNQWNYDLREKDYYDFYSKLTELFILIDKELGFKPMEGNIH